MFDNDFAHNATTKSADCSLLQRQRSEPSWRDWRWQQQHSARSAEALAAYFPGLGWQVLDRVRKHVASKRLSITPYFMSLVELTGDTNLPKEDDPLWVQVIPTEDNHMLRTSTSYNSRTDNWEHPSEMVTPIAQRKYDNRLIVRLSNVCQSYCQFCYEALRTLERQSSKPAFRSAHWRETLAYIEREPAIEEVILSGGEPLMLDNESLGEVLSSLRRLRRPILIRIHTRTLTFNPFRIDTDLLGLLRDVQVNAIGIHVTHPREISTEFIEAAQKLRAGCPILFANVPLLRGVNDSEATIHRLGMSLYAQGITFQYLYHFMPFSPGAAKFRTPVKKGLQIVQALKRRVTNLAVPEFVLPHHSGKYTPPLIESADDLPKWTLNEHHEPIVRYRNWQGELVDYPDVIESDPTRRD